MIITNRLILIDLQPEELRFWLDDCSALERKYIVTYRGEDLSGEFGSIVAKQTAVVENDPSHYIWLTFWWFVRQSDRVVLGSACFKSIPHDGQVEIGYGIGSDYALHGYTTEAVKALCTFAFTFAEVKTIIAETDPKNIASQRVLQKCGMVKYQADEKSIWWRLEK
ncbi:MAG: GNAT family N-acetyltransferase [Candidatus Izemoplasmatales bacterium]